MKSFKEGTLYLTNSEYEINNLKCMHEWYVRRQDNLEAAGESDGTIFLFLPP